MVCRILKEGLEFIFRLYYIGSLKTDWWELSGQAVALEDWEPGDCRFEVTKAAKINSEF